MADAPSEKELHEWDVEFRAVAGAAKKVGWGNWDPFRDPKADMAKKRSRARRVPRPPPREEMEAEMEKEDAFLGGEVEDQIPEVVKEPEVASVAKVCAKLR
jgi:hypothetical protein